MTQGNYPRSKEISLEMRAMPKSITSGMNSSQAKLLKTDFLDFLESLILEKLENEFEDLFIFLSLEQLRNQMLRYWKYKRLQSLSLPDFSDSTNTIMVSIVILNYWY